MFFRGKKLKANVGIRCYLHIFRSFLKVLDVILKTIKASMCYLGVIEVYIFYSSEFDFLEQSTLLSLS